MAGHDQRQPDRALHAVPGGHPELKRRGGGSIVNVSSLAGQNPSPACLLRRHQGRAGRVSNALIRSYGKHDIRVSVVAPARSPPASAAYAPTAADAWICHTEDVAETISTCDPPGPQPPSRVDLRPRAPRRVKAGLQTGRSIFARSARPDRPPARPAIGPEPMPLERKLPRLRPPVLPDGEITDGATIAASSTATMSWTGVRRSRR